MQSVGSLLDELVGGSGHDGEHRTSPLAYQF